MEQKCRIGDWEADTIIGQHHRGAILSLVERKSKLRRLKKVEHNTAELVEQAIEELLQPLEANCHTITSEDGREFANHQAIAAKLVGNFLLCSSLCSLGAVLLPAAYCQQLTHVF